MIGSAQPEDYKYALSLMARGMSASNASRMSGVRVDGLTGYAAPRRTEYTPLPPISRVLSFEPYGPHLPSRSERIILTIKAVAERYGFTLEDMRGMSRTRPVSWTRHEAAWTIRTKYGLSLPQTARYLGNRDHTTILNSIWKHEAKMAWVEFLKGCADVDSQMDLFA